MIAIYLVLLIPVFSVMLMGVIGHRRSAGFLNIILSAATFFATLYLAKYHFQYGALLSASKQFYIDGFSLLSILLTAFVVTTTAIFSNEYMWHNLTSGRITPNKLRLYHVMYQTFVFMMLLSFATNNIGILWVAMEGATLATVLLVSLYRTPEAIEAAWKYFILCIVGIALALFGTILIYISTSQTAAFVKDGFFWSVLYQHANIMNASIVKLAFVFLLVGYGTKIGLVPFHNWLPDAHSESPAPMSTLLSGLLLNAALYSLVRFKIITDLALNTHLAGNLMMAFGLLSFLVAAVLLHRQNNIKRMFSYSSIEHMGLMTFGFGLGGHLATFAALFYMLMHSLVKSAIFVTVGNVIQLAGTQNMEKIRGIIRNQPLIGWVLLIATVAISGFPPFGIFTSELMLVIATLKSVPYLALLLVIGLLIALAGLLRNIQPVVYGTPNESAYVRPNIISAVLHLAIVFVLGVYIPPILAQLLQQAATLIVGNV